MVSQNRKIGFLVAFLVILISIYPVAAWAGPALMDDEEMENVYAKGIFVDFDINIALPGGSSFSMPNVPVSIPSPGVISSGNGSTANLSASTPSSPVGSVSVPASGGIPVASSGSMGSPSINVATPGTKNFQPNFLGTPGIILSDNAMSGNSGMIINAPSAAISLILNVVVLNNSTIGGNVFQTSTSNPVSLMLNVTTFWQ